MSNSTIHRVQQLYIKWVIDERPLLAIALGRSGTISRAGDGSPEHAQHVFMGRGEAEAFDALMAAWEEDWFELAGRYTLPDPKGDPATLTISFSSDELDTGVEFHYGTESEGPPEELVDWVERALDLTQPWWEDQLAQRSQKKRR